MDSTLFAERRTKVLSRMGKGVLLVPSAPVAIRNNDVEHAYRQDSDLYYLTGFDEPESLLLLTTQHPEHRSVLFVRPRHKEREIWDGYRAGVEGAKSRYGVDAAFPIEELSTRLPDYLEDVDRLHVRLGRVRAFDDVVFGAVDAVRARARKGVRAPTEYVDPTVILHDLRLRKDSVEVSLMRHAARISGEGHLAAMRAALPGRYEYEVEAELLHAFRRGGAERPAYECIVGSGPNATVLHYRKNDRRLEEGDLLLIDAGCEYGYYASDITRTFPVSGRFTEPQRQLYEIVLEAEEAALAAVRPGRTLEEIHDVALRILVEGLVRVGLLDGSVEERLADGAYRDFYMHRTSHWLGMDVHDVGGYFVEGRRRTLEPGMVLTIEPGLYVQPDAAVDPRFRGIGNRIEDDVLVTESGHENLTAHVPKSVADLEAILGSR